MCSGEICPQSPNLCKMQPWEGTVTCMNMAPGVRTVKWVWAELESWQQMWWIPSDMSHPSILVFLFSPPFLNRGTCLDILLSFFHSAVIFVCLPSSLSLFFLFYFSIHLRTFLLFSCLLSRLWGAKQLLAFLLSFVCKVFGFSLPLLFSWEMAEAVFRERGLEDLTEEKNIYGYF